jgi:hypothetical protein
MCIVYWVTTDTHSENIIVVFPIATLVTYEIWKFSIYSCSIKLMYQRHCMTSKNSYSRIPPKCASIFKFMGLCEGLNNAGILVIELVQHV